MIRKERLESTKEMINKYSNKTDILRVNYNNTKEILKDMQENSKEVYVSGLGIDYTLEEIKESNKLYKRAINRAYRRKAKEN